MTIINPRVGVFIDWLSALVGDPADSTKLGTPMVKVFNHLRRFRAMEYVASYSGRIDPDINGNHLSRFHIISRFPERNNSGDAELGITMDNWLWGYGAVNEQVYWRKVFDGGITNTLLDTTAVPNTVLNDGVNSKPSGPRRQWAVDVTPEAIGTADGFRCSRLDINNAMVHRLNVFGCPVYPDLAADEALIGLADVSVGRVLQGWDEGNDDGTIGVLAHYMDAGDSCIHNTSRALFNTPYALGVYQSGVNPAGSLRQDAATGATTTYRVKPRNLTGAAGNVDCDPAIMVYGGAGAVVTFSSSVAGDSVTYTIPGGGLAVPTLVTVSDFTDQLEVDDALDYVTVSGTSAGGIELHVQTVSLWEPYRYR